MRHPFNWLTVWLMLFIAGIALHLILQAFGVHAPAVAPSGNPKTNQVAT